MPRFVNLYSGSSGNCSAIESQPDGEFVLVDMGASRKATLGAMVAAGLSPRNLKGILVTHEHSDHIKGLNVFLKHIPVPVYASKGTLDALEAGNHVPEDTQLIPVRNGGTFELAGFTVTGFATSHDAADCRGYRMVAACGTPMAIATDLGKMTPEVYAYFEGVAMAALEANYDPEMLRRGPYPAYLKKRIASPVGHLSNQDAANTIACLIASGTRRVALCHLSEENNHPRLARAAVDDALQEHGLPLPQDCFVQVARRHEVSNWMEY